MQTMHMATLEVHMRLIIGYATGRLLQKGNNNRKNQHKYGKNLVKDGAARYSGFLWVVPTNTGIFLHGLKLCGESRT